MESTARLYQCMLCHEQVTICRKCDRGNIYCASECASRARTISVRLAGARYQATPQGKRRNAARQAYYRINHIKKVTHQGSLPTTHHAPIKSIKNKPEKTETGQNNLALTCCFCNKPISAWLRNDFLRRRGPTKSNELMACPQAP